MEVREAKGDVAFEADELAKALAGNIEDFKDFEEKFNSVINVSQDSVNALNDYIDSVNAAAEANRYYTQQIFKNTIEEQYGEQFREWATDSEGNFD
jgi:TRAP-type mannitol/chloroaromatic compound transport system substrate-binding protein